MKRLFAIPILLFLALVMFVYLVLPKYKQYSLSSKNVGMRQESLERKIKYFSDLRKIAEKLDDYDEQMAKVSTALPEDPSYPSLFHYIQNVASSNGLILTSVFPMANPKAEDTEVVDRIKEMRFEVSLVGSHQSLESFLITIEKSARMFEIESISMREPEEDLPEIKLMIKVYSY